MMSHVTMGATRVRAATEHGQVEGVLEHGVAVFRNIPFAAPPFGARRFRPPQPPQKWQGVRDASVSGPAPPQPALEGGDPVDATWFNVSTTGEDCLTLEIWTPDPGANALPVMVWIYGGGYMIGSASSGAYSGRHFARDGVVHVALNYRVGVDGFVYLGEGTDNLGLRDQVAGLEWVQRNIAAFGGDPAKVTVFGQSAGGVSVLNLLAMPSAKGLFVRAIAQSGSPVGSVSPEAATKVTRRLARRLRVAPTRAGFETTTVAQTVAQTMPFAFDFANAFRHGSQSFMISPFRAVHGTPSLPEPPIAAAAAAPSVPLITGCTRNETITFLKLLGRTDGINPFVGWFFKRMLGVKPAMIEAYREGPRRITNPLAIVEAAWTDWAFRMPTLRLVETRVAATPAVPTWLYEFRWNSPGFPAGLGAFHALEVPFVRDELDALRAVPGSEAWIGDERPDAMAAFMHAAWVRFARTGDPGWPAYDLAHRQTMVFDTASAVVPDAAAPERQAWKGHR
jgi:carboxylesterase type B